MSDADDLIASGYDSFYVVWGRSPTLRQIWREHVTGPDYPEEFAHISFLPLRHLRTLARGLDLSENQLVVDLACGAGGPGLWVARESRARLVGCDLSSVAVERGAERATALGMSGRAEFRHGSFEETGLASEAADAVMTVDALQYAPNKAQAFAEVARIDVYKRQTTPSTSARPTSKTQLPLFLTRPLPTASRPRLQTAWPTTPALARPPATTTSADSTGCSRAWAVMRPTTPVPKDTAAGRYRTPSWALARTLIPTCSRTTPTTETGPSRPTPRVVRYGQTSITTASRPK